MDSRFLFPRKRALSPTRGLVLFFVFVVGRESLGLFLSWAGGFGGADGDVRVKGPESPHSACSAGR